MLHNLATQIHPAKNYCLIGLLNIFKNPWINNKAISNITYAFF